MAENTRLKEILPKLSSRLKDVLETEVLSSRLKDVTIDVKQFSKSISAIDHHLQALIATLNDRHKDDSK